MFAAAVLAFEQYNISVNVDEYTTKAAEPMVNLTVIAYKADLKTANCTFKWNGTTDVMKYVSTCNSNATTTTATGTQIQAFDTIEFYNNGTKLYTLNKANLAIWGLLDTAITDFFKVIVDYTVQTDFTAIVTEIAKLSAGTPLTDVLTAFSTCIEATKLQSILVNLKASTANTALKTKLVDVATASETVVKTLFTELGGVTDFATSQDLKSTLQNIANIANHAQLTATLNAIKIVTEISQTIKDLVTKIIANAKNQDFLVKSTNFGLFFATFTTDISQVTLNIINTADPTKNITVYKLEDNYHVAAKLNNLSKTVETYQIIGFQNGDRVFSQSFPYDNANAKNGSQPYVFTKVVLPQILPTNTTTPTGVPVNVTRFLINLTHYINQTKTAVDNITYCDDVIIKVYSNNSLLTQIPNGGYCVVAIISDTQSLIPYKDFVMNATFAASGALAFQTTAKLTPRMISDWVETAKNSNNAVFIELSTVSSSGLTGGEIAAIVIGSVTGFVMLVVAAVFIIRWCIFGMMAPAAAPKMMM